MGIFDEENYLADKKEFRKERKRFQLKDRSKFKKTDEEKRPSTTLPKEGRRGRIVSITAKLAFVNIDGALISSQIKGSLKKEKGKEKNLIAVGDFVYLDDRDQIIFVEPRYSYLARADNLHQKKKHVLAANIDQVLITVSVASPPLKLSLIDRYIIAAERGNMSPVLVINKIDLPHDEAFIQEIASIYTKLEIPVIEVSATTLVGFDKLKEVMQDRVSVFSGQSGVGKTSLINLLTGSNRRVADIIERTQKGAHTTTQTELIELENGGFCVDTPGIKSFALYDIPSSEILHHFSDLQMYAKNCKFVNCSHRHEPGCGVKAAVEEGLIPSLRYDSYINIVEKHDEDQKHPWD